MKKYLFRGKRIDNNEWIYGFYTNYNNISYIKTIDDNKRFGCGIDVIPETVSMYIGGKGFVDDKNEHFKKGESIEQELFENDIVEAWSQGSKGTFMIKYREDGIPSFILYPAFQQSQIFNIAFSDVGRDKGDYYDDLRIIGNIFDNPEIIKNDRF